MIIDEGQFAMDKIFLNQLEVQCIIGIYKRERVQKQTVWIDLEIPCHADHAAQSDDIRHAVNYKHIAKRVLNLTKRSRFYLIETLAEKIAQTLLKEFELPEITLTVSKPGAVRFSKNVGLKISRFTARKHAKRVLAYLGWGSNLKKSWSLKTSTQLLSENFTLLKQSAVYESPAMGMPASPSFWNSVIEIETSESARALKSKLLTIEKQLGRKRTQNKHISRVADFDILFYGGKTLKSRDLNIPHPDTLKMPYVLVPMTEIAPHFIHPTTGRTMLETLAALAPQPISKVSI